MAPALPSRGYNPENTRAKLSNSPKQTLSAMATSAMAMTHPAVGEGLYGENGQIDLGAEGTIDFDIIFLRRSLCAPANAIALGGTRRVPDMEPSSSSC